MSAKYAWKITHDHLYEPALTDADGSLNEAGTTGPSNASDELLKRLDDGDGAVFRMFDDDGELYYTGLFVPADLADSEEGFGPLWDFGTPNAGCTEIKYKHNGEWRTL